MGGGGGGGARWGGFSGIFSENFSISNKISVFIECRQLDDDIFNFDFDVVFQKFPKRTKLFEVSKFSQSCYKFITRKKKNLFLLFAYCLNQFLNVVVSTKF